MSINDLWVWQVNAEVIRVRDYTNVDNVLWYSAVGESLNYGRKSPIRWGKKEYPPWENWKSRELFCTHRLDHYGFFYGLMKKDTATRDRIQRKVEKAFDELHRKRWNIFNGNTEAKGEIQTINPSITKTL